VIANPTTPTTAAVAAVATAYAPSDHGTPIRPYTYPAIAAIPNETGIDVATDSRRGSWAAAPTITPGTTSRARRVTMTIAMSMTRLRP